LFVQTKLTEWSLGPYRKAEPLTISCQTERIDPAPPLQVFEIDTQTMIDIKQIDTQTFFETFSFET